MAHRPAVVPVDRNIYLRQEITNPYQLLLALMGYLVEFTRFDRGPVNIAIDARLDHHEWGGSLHDLCGHEKFGPLATRCRLLAPDKTDDNLNIQAVIGQVHYNETAKNDEPLLRCEFTPKGQIDSFSVAVGVLVDGRSPTAICSQRMDVPWLSQATRRMLVPSLV